MAGKCNRDATIPEQSRLGSRCVDAVAGRQAPSAEQMRDNAIGGASAMNNIIYIVGLIVVVLAILSFLGLR